MIKFVTMINKNQTTNERTKTGLEYCQQYHPPLRKVKEQQRTPEVSTSRNYHLPLAAT